MRALVTGGAGFVGSNLVDALVARGDRVVVLDDLSTGRVENLAGALAAGAVLCRGDVSDAAPAAQIERDHRPEVVLHFAAQIDVRRSVADPAFDARVNVGGTVGMLQLARAAGASRFVLASTGGAIYGEADDLPTSESAPARPLSPYGQAKLAAEGYCELYRRLYGLSTIALRFPNIYGPRQDPLGEGGVVAIFHDRLRRGEDLVVYGDGRQTRDFLHVSDAVAAALLAADATCGGALNLGTGSETSVLDLVAAMAPAGVPVRHLAARPGEVRRSCLDARAARERLGWAPRVGLAEGLAMLDPP